MEKSGSPPRLVLVDDNDEFRGLVRAVAEPLGWEVGEFSNGKEFLAAIGRIESPDLILLDLVMPDMDGIETVGALGASSMRSQVILVTGALPLYAQTAAELGRAHGIEVAALLQKPVSLRDLREALDPEKLRARP